PLPITVVWSQSAAAGLQPALAVVRRNRALLHHSVSSDVRIEEMPSAVHVFRPRVIYIVVASIQFCAPISRSFGSQVEDEATAAGATRDVGLRAFAKAYVNRLGGEQGTRLLSALCGSFGRRRKEGSSDLSHWRWVVR